MNDKNKITATVLKVVISVVCLLVAGLLMSTVFNGKGASVTNSAGISTDFAMSNRFEQHMTNRLSDAMDGLLSIKKVYWLNDDDLIAPEPNQSCYGQVTNPKDMLPIIEKAADLLDGQELLFDVNAPIWDGEPIRYYYDETILAITWKQPVGTAMYTFSEVKIAHPSQFRRFVADGDYYSNNKYTAVEMAATANAVVAANGDFYTFRNMGIIVYDSTLMRAEGWDMDSCLIDKNGDLHFIRRTQLHRQEDIQAYVEEHGVRFSIAFGPILVEDGKVVVTGGPYPVSEGNESWPRGALCQHGELHYVVVAANDQGGRGLMPTNVEFAQGLQSVGIKKAYNLDGGQSATIVMNDERINLIWLRQISDIIYFATAIPDGE